MHPRERTVQHNGHKCHAAILSLEKLKQQKFDRFLFTVTAAVQAMLPCQWTLLPHIAYPFTLREVTTVARYLRQSVSCDVLGQGNRGKTADRRHILRGSST